MTEIGQQKIFPAESADIKHFVSGQKRRNDHYLHASIHYEGHVDIGLLKKAVTATFQAVPLLSCRFEENTQKADWIEAGWTAEDMIKVVYTDDRNQTIHDHLVIKLDEKTGPQIRITVIRDEQSDTLAIVLNHMVCDGGGFRDYLYLLSKCYSFFEGHPGVDKLPFEMPSPENRSIHQVFDHMTGQQMQEILNATLHSFPQSDLDHLPLTGNEDNPFIITHRVSAERFNTIKNYAKERGATINDALFAAYICALSDALKGERIVLDCPVNIRAFLPKDYLPGICNLTSNIICAVPRKSGITFDESLSLVKRVMDEQKGSLEPLKVYWELEKAYETLPLEEAKKKFPEIYRIPLNGLTNIGILDKESLKLGKLDPIDAYISGSVKYKPYFQIAVTTFCKAMTFSTNFHGTQSDYEWLDQFVHRMISYFPEPG